MNKKEARAILACQAKIEKAIDACLLKLAGDELDYANAYWAAHIRSSIGGNAYGAMPIGLAKDTLGIE